MPSLSELMGGGGERAIMDDWFTQQGAPGGGGAPGAGANQYEIDPSTGTYYPGNRIMPDGSAWIIGISADQSRQVAPPGSFDPNSGTGINNPARPTGQTPIATADPGTVADRLGRGGVTGAGGGRMSDAQAQQFFDRLFPGGTVSPQDLEAHRAELEAAGFQLNPNAGGLITDLTLPSGNTVDPIYGAGSGINRKQWIVHPGGGGGAGDPLTALQSAPGYQFRLGEGMKALERSAAARGTLLTGGTLKGLNRFAQDYASNEYQNRYNQLFGLAGLGQNAAGAQAGANSAYATNAGDLQTQIGNAQAAGTVGGANALNQALGGATNLAQMYYLSRLFGGGGAGVPPGPQMAGGYPGVPGYPAV